MLKGRPHETTHFICFLFVRLHAATKALSSSSSSSSSSLATLPAAAHPLVTAQRGFQRCLSPSNFRSHCAGNWGAERMSLKKLLDQAGKALLMRMIPVKPGISETSIALGSALKLHFKLGAECDDAELCVAAHHWWAPSLMSKNYESSKGNRPSQFQMTCWGCSKQHCLHQRQLTGQSFSQVLSTTSRESTAPR